MTNKKMGHFKDKTAEQIYSLCLLFSCVFIMLLCFFARIFGILWFSADLSAIQEPSLFWQEFIKGALLVFELIFVYKILCRAKWGVCFLIALIETLIGIFISALFNNAIIVNSFYMLCYLVIPIFFVKKWWSILENLLLYVIGFLYCVIFLVGRIGNLQLESAYNFIYNILGTIDYKLFIVSLYLVIKYFGGIKICSATFFQKSLPI